MPKEQKLTIQSPLADLAKPGVVRQHALIPQAVPHDMSRFSIAQIAFTLRRGKEAIKRVLSRDRSGGHMLKTEHQPSGSSSSLSWFEGENKRVVATAELPGDVKMTTEGQSVVFISETGAMMKYHSSGAVLYSPTPLRHQY